MNGSQRIWALARDGLTEALTKEGFPAELSDLLARQLKSPRAIDRMASYVRQAHPRTVEMLADEMLAICAEIDAWREKKRSEEAQAGYNEWLMSDLRGEEE